MIVLCTLIGVLSGLALGMALGIFALSRQQGGFWRLFWRDSQRYELPASAYDCDAPSKEDTANASRR